jgi:hypothetical protein
MARSAAAAPAAPPQWVPPQLTELVDAAPQGGEWLHEIKFDGYRMHARLDRGAVKLLTRIRRARNAVKCGGVQAVELSDRVEITPGKLSLGTIHLTKGLEFRAVAIMAYDEIIRSQERIETVGDDADLEELYIATATCSTSPAPVTTY